MISRAQALQHISAVSAITETERVPLQASVGRVLAEDIIARHTQPPDNLSAMDGYAARFADSGLNERLTVIGEAAAGHPFAGEVGAGQCVRVFTGSVIPHGADHVIIQEDVARDDNTVEIIDAQTSARHIRKAGIDFSQDDTLIPAGTRLTARQLSICAAANHADLSVRRRPRVALLANGDELRPPGSVLEPGQIIASNEYSLTALIEAWGGEVNNLGIAADDPDDIKARIAGANDADLFVPVGGASVGDHDHMKTVFAALEFEPVFSKIAVRPGKPTWMSEHGGHHVLGLPGNPASALVCAHLFLKPLIAQLLGLNNEETTIRAALSAPIDSNDRRESFLRGRLTYSQAGERTVTPAGNQDSSLLSPFVTSNVLIHRGVDAPAQDAGTLVDCVLLD